MDSYTVTCKIDRYETRVITVKATCAQAAYNHVRKNHTSLKSFPLKVLKEVTNWGK